MTTTSTMTAEAAALQHFLDAQRASALAIIDGLTDEQLRTPVLPSGWTPLGLIQHLGDAERHWFQTVARGTAVDLPWPDNGRGRVFTSSHPVAEVVAFYREQCERGNAVLATTPLDTKPVGRHGGRADDEVTDLRRITLHMIEETARHLGHLDAARELLDGPDRPRPALDLSPEQRSGGAALNRRILFSLPEHSENPTQRPRSQDPAPPQTVVSVSTSLTLGRRIGTRSVTDLVTGGQSKRPLLRQKGPLTCGLQ